MTSQVPRVLAWIARLLIRGDAAPTVLGDLDEALDRDLAGGLSPWRAYGRYLRNALGSGVSLSRERRRQRRSRRGLGVSLLDVKLGLRMLVKHPGLTAVAIFALALGIPASLVPTHLFNSFFGSDLPFEGGDRIVGLRYLTVGPVDDRLGSSFEYQLWRERLSGLEGIGAARTERYNVVAGDGRVAPVRGAQTSASTFRLLGVPPLLGRPLLDSDEVPGAPDVVVLSHDLWRSGYAGTPDVVGRTLMVAGEPHSIVGVMPEGFRFPLSDQLWLPLRTAPAAEPRVGPGLFIYARLAEGVDEDQVLAQMESLHAGPAERFPEALGDVRPQVASFVNLVTQNSGSDEDIAIVVVWQLFSLLLLSVACGNVGTLILARTSARSGELAIRTALGASRLRIVTQLFVESLVLALIASGVGLGVAYFVAERFHAMVQGANELPFWFDLRLGPPTVIAGLALAVFCAGIAGVVPALKATGGKIQGSLQRAAAGRSGVRFGGVASALIIAEVALGVASLFGGGIALLMAPELGSGTEIAVERLLTAQVSVGRPGGALGEVEESAEARGERVASVHREIVRRLDAEPGIRGAALTRTLPAGMVHPTGRIEVEAGGDDAEDSGGQRVLVGRVGVGYFETLGVSVVSGRTFQESDLEAYERDGSAPVIVNTAFVDRVLGGRNPIGQRVRYVVREGEEPERWHEVVGVVGGSGLSNFDLARDDAGLFHPLAPGEQRGIVWIALRVEGDPAAMVPRVREVVARIDPTTLLDEPRTVRDLLEEGRIGINWALLAVGVIAGIAIVLSVAGLYALMSFTVAQRTREIGVRAALGADAGRITWLIARRAMAQLTVGIALGASVSLVIVQGAAPELFTWLEGSDMALVWAAGGVLLVGALACVAPTRRGLNIQPMEALRADG